MRSDKYICKITIDICNLFARCMGVYPRASRWPNVCMSTSPVQIQKAKRLLRSLRRHRKGQASKGQRPRKAPLVCLAAFLSCVQISAYLYASGAMRQQRR